MAEQDDKPIRVVDRRMFTPEGEPRPDFEPEEPPEPIRPAPQPREAPERATLAAESPQGESARSEEPAEPEPAEPREPATSFGSLVGWIATNAYAGMGLLPDAGGRAHRDLATARQMIDWLAVLEQKTRGNLTFEESDFLSRALYELRLAFVEVSRRPTK